MEIETGHCWKQAQADMSDVPRNVPYGVSGFLTWLMLWFRLCVEQSGRRSEQTPLRAYQPNRHRRRMVGRKISPIRNNRPYYSFVRRSMTPGQFTEWLASYSGRGRVSVYRMRYWRKTVKGKAAPLGTEHEYWRDPLGRIGKHMGRLPVGVWHGHVWPGWRGLFFELYILTPVKTSSNGGGWVMTHVRNTLKLSTRLHCPFINGHLPLPCAHPT